MNTYVEQYKEEYKSAINELISDDNFVREDIIGCLENYPQHGIIIKDKDEIVAVGVFTGADKKSSMSLYVKPSGRRAGFGTMLLKALENNMKTAGVEEIVCDFKNNEIEKLFLYKNKYENWFYSNLMIYSGDKLTVAAYDIVNYKDEDYYECEKISSEAFHKMRLLVGLKSTLSSPSEEGKRSYKENAANIFVLRDHNQIVATAILSDNEIDSIAVSLDKQGKGYGKALVKHSINELLNRGHKNVKLWVIEGNPAKFLYESLGFKTERTHEFVVKTIR